MQIKEPLWTSAELNAVCGGIIAQPWFADGLQVDSREILPGDIYVALVSEQHDGHLYVADALSRGAIAAIISRSTEGVDMTDPRLVHVANTFSTLQKMASHARDRAPAKTIAVTGTAGKTSVIYALRECLEPIGITHVSAPTLIDQFSVPLSLARLPRQSRFSVFEVGANQHTSVSGGAEMVRPDIAIVTAIGSGHAESFATDEAIAVEKASLIRSLRPGGTAIIGIDHDHGDLLQQIAKEEGVQLLTVSVLGDGDVKPIRMTEHHNCTCLTADVFGTPVTYKVSQPGREWVLNSLLVLAAVKAAGADLGQATVALANLAAVSGRGRTHKLNLSLGQATLIDDSFNATPLGVKAALRRLALSPVIASRKRVAVLSDMAELGDRSEEIHLSLVSDLRRSNVNKMIAFGDRMASIGEFAGIETERWTSPLHSAERLMAELEPGDAVMVKGANHTRLGGLVHEMLKISGGELDVNGAGIRTGVSR